MKKQTKNILIVLIIALLLGGVLCFLLLTGPEKEEQDTEPESVAESSEAAESYLLQTNLKDIKSVKVANENSEYTIVLTHNGDTTSYTVAGFENSDLKTAALSTMVQLFTETKITKEIGEVENLKEFGLDGKTCAVAELADGSKLTVMLGTEPGESAGRYVLLEDKVYICPVNQAFYEKTEYVVNPASWTISELTDGETNFSLLKAVHLSGTAYEREIDMTYNEADADYDLNEPVKAKGSITMGDTLAAALLTFSCSSTEKVNPTEEELGEMGLDKPYAEISFTLNGYTHSVTVGNTCAGGRYCYVDKDSSVVYTVSESMISSWISLNEVDFRDGYVTLQTLNGVDKLAVEADGKTPITIERTRTLKDGVEKAESLNDYDYASFVDGKEIDTAEMRAFYRACIGIPILNMQSLEKDGDAVIKITFHHFDNDEDTVVEYYKVKKNESRYVAYMNGEYSATVRSTSIEEFMSAYDSFTEAIK